MQHVHMDHLKHSMGIMNRRTGPSVFRHINHVKEA